MAYDLLVESEPARELPNGVTTSPIFRSKLLDGDLVQEFEGRRTTYELFTHGCRQFAGRRLHGKREQFVDGSAGEYRWQTYTEVEEVVNSVAKAMRLQGCETGAKVGIYSANCPEWTQAMFACTYFSAVCVPLYDTLGVNAVEHAILHGEIEFIFVAERKVKELGAVVQALQTKANQIREICIWTDCSRTNNDDIRAARQIFEGAGIRVENWVELVQRGTSPQAAAVEMPLPPSDPETIAVLMYTSGTTGLPKGVAISHRAIASATASTILFSQKTGILTEGEEAVALSWLPCAHIYGFVMEIVGVTVGSRIGYWQGERDRLLDDVAQLKPTQFFAVPRLWTIIVEKATQKLEQRGALIKGLFDLGFYYKKSVLESGTESNLLTYVLDSTLFSRIRQALGGQVQFVGSGAAPLPRHVEEFLRVALGVPLIQGYGLTETCAVTCLNYPNRYDQNGTVGSVTPCVELRLQSVSQMGYDAHGSPPAGEICFRGPCLFSEYYKNPEESQKVIDADGFFHTGDIGELQPSGALKIIDRIKNIFKLSQGEYVAVEKVESVLQQASTVEQIWVYGDSCQRFLVAVVCPNVPKLRQLLEEDLTLDAICASEAAKKEILKELTAVAKSSGLKGFERVHDIALMPEEFSVENGLMTPSQKLKRHDLLKRYKDIIDALYAESS